MNALPQKTGIRAPIVAPDRGTAPAPDVPTSHPLAAILDVLHRGERFLICSHTRPDGDAVGSMLALGMVIEQMGKAAHLVTADRVPIQYWQLPGTDAIHTMPRIRGRYDAAILLECDSLERTRLRGLEDLFVINIDHHITGLEFAHLNWIDHSAASVGEMVYQLARAAGAAITPQMAQCLYTTILTDTGGFCYGNVRESTFALARELVQAGADPIAIAQQVYFSVSASKLLLLGAALRRLKREGCLAWLWVTHQDTQRACATEEDCEGIVNVALGMAGVDTGVFLRELPDGGIRLSLRSKGKLNVAAIAARLGGGGHQNAAGCTLQGPLPRALKEILAELRGAL
ncbi:MAG TPA: bifunctional oligoribonuclease/PAP phosphatase NrnA [Terracidiphilus sp.]|nr:bifunctional oligoribonuclease/PAP phosphatase NrnA [Terracidiphilus sp.]